MDTGERWVFVCEKVEKEVARTVLKRELGSCRLRWLVT